MNWYDMAAWLDQDWDPNIDQIIAHKIKTVYVDPRAENAMEAILTLKGHGIVPGLYAVAGWQDTGNTPAEFAKWCSLQLNHFLPRGTAPEAPPFMVDIEQPHTTQYTTSFLNAYRTYQPHRPSSYTCEPFQGGLVPCSMLLGLGFHWYPQCYYGNMDPADIGAVVLEAVREFPAQKVHPFYDGARLPSDARDGCVFTLGRLT